MVNSEKGQGSTVSHVEFEVESCVGEGDRLFRLAMGNRG